MLAEAGLGQLKVKYGFCGEKGCDKPLGDAMGRSVNTGVPVCPSCAALQDNDNDMDDEVESTDDMGGES
jgi:hypothetical protein